MSDRISENPKLFARIYDADGKPVRERPIKPAEAVAAVRRGVESGTIKGEVVRWCEIHDSSADQRAQRCHRWIAVPLQLPPLPGDCSIVDASVIPVSDGGSET